MKLLTYDKCVIKFKIKFGCYVCKEDAEMLSKAELKIAPYEYIKDEKQEGDD